MTLLRDEKLTADHCIDTQEVTIDERPVLLIDGL